MSVWAGYDEPRMDAVIVSVERLRDREETRYKLILATNDPRMAQAKRDCDHPSVEGGVCRSCSILVGETENS